MKNPANRCANEENNFPGDQNYRTPGTYRNAADDWMRRAVHSASVVCFAAPQRGSWRPQTGRWDKVVVSTWRPEECVTGAGVVKVVLPKDKPWSLGSENLARLRSSARHTTFMAMDECREMVQFVSQGDWYLPGQLHGHASVVLHWSRRFRDKLINGIYTRFPPALQRWPDELQISSPTLKGIRIVRVYAAQKG